MATTAILCVARNENPFTAEWLEYHFKLGFDRIHFISTDEDFAAVEAFMAGSPFRSKVNLYHFSDFRPGWQIHCYNLHFRLIKEDWVLVLDLDEYLYLHTFTDIQSFLDTVEDEIGQVQFPWLNLTSDRYYHEYTFDILCSSKAYVSDHVKSMVRHNVTESLGIHSHNISQQKTVLSSGDEVRAAPTHRVFLSDTQFCQRYAYILHFTSRGHFDVLNRIISHRFFNSKNGPEERERTRQFLSSEHTWKHIPNRFLLMLFYKTLPTVDMEIKLPDLNAQTDLVSLLKLFTRNINKLLDCAPVEMDRLDEEFENRYHLVEKLLHLDLSEHCDLQAYQACGSQLEYIGRLRKQLSDHYTAERE